MFTGSQSIAKVLYFPPTGERFFSSMMKERNSETVHVNKLISLNKECYFPGEFSYIAVPY